MNRVVPVDELEAAVRELAGRHRRQRAAHRAGVQGRHPRGAARPGQRDLDAVERMVEACFRSEDYLEGQAAFAEKRAPQFRGV